MDFRARLVHADSERRVVRVRAFEGERCLGSALGEAVNAEEAEDRARARLLQRLRPPGQIATPPPLPVSVAPPPRAADAEPARPPSLPAGPPSDPLEPPPDPEDWSADLAQLDRLLATIGWGRDQERIYVQRLFGHPSRSRLTRHADLMALRRALEALPPGSAPDTAPIPLLRGELLKQCDDLLAQLSWPVERARQCLEGHFGVNSRQRLSDEQLLAFNLLLEGELLGPAGLGGADGFLELTAVHSQPSPS